MAQVAQEPKTKAWIDHDLDYLMREWRAVPDVAREWDNWDELDRLVFVVEWPLRADRMMRLAYWSEQGELTPAQADRCRELLGLVECYQPTLDRLLAD